MFKKEVVFDKTVGTSKETAVKVTKTDGKMITTDELKKLYHEIAKETDKKFKEYKIRVRALNPIQWMTLKGFSDVNLNLDDAEEYLHGKVSHASKFTEFFQVEICIIR